MTDWDICILWMVIMLVALIGGIAWLLISKD